MKIKFKHVDDDFPKIEEWIMPIVNISTRYEIFVRIVCELLNVYGEFHESLYNTVEKALKKFRYILDSEDDDLQCSYDELSGYILNFYYNVISDEFARDLFRYDQDKYNKYHFEYAQNRIARYRGLLFEELVAALVKKRFENHMFERGCRVYINGERVMAHYGKGNASHKETFDIVGWIKGTNYGEFYECKINPERFEVSNYKLFMILSDKLKQHNVPQYTICLVSADADETLKARKEYIEQVDSDCYCDFLLIGRDSIMSICDMTIPDMI